MFLTKVQQMMTRTNRREVLRLALPAALAVTFPATARADNPIQQGDTPMMLRDLYPLITTPDLFAARDFHIRHFGLEVLFQASWFVYLTRPGQDGTRGATLAFMHPDHPSNPPGPESFDGRGMILTIEVEDAAAAHDQLRQDGAPILYPLTDEPWGQRRFMTRDPAGVQIDIVQQTRPEPGFWDRFPVAAAYASEG